MSQPVAISLLTRTTSSPRLSCEGYPDLREPPDQGARQFRRVCKRVQRHLSRAIPRGWPLIGQTDAVVWDVHRPDPALLTLRKWVQFWEAR